MSMYPRALPSVFLFLAVLLPLAGAQAQVAINQTNALAGGVTPGDTVGFPVTLSQPGSYRLTSNLSVPAGVDGIVAGAVEVTIDLNGFRVDGGGVARDGIVGQQRNLTVRNGTVRKFVGNGITNNGAALLVDSVRVQENRGTGVADVGPSSAYGVIKDASILGNGVTGVACIVACVVRDSTIARNGNFGVLTKQGGLVLGNTIVANRFGLGGDETAAGSNMIAGNATGNTLNILTQGNNVCGDLQSC